MTPKVLRHKEDGDRIVDFELTENAQLVTIGECCDNWFGVNLTKAEFGEFLAELQTLHARMVE